MYADFDHMINLTDPDVVQAIWEKGIEIKGYDKNLYRQDVCGAWMARDAYGDTSRDMGWQIDHIYPKNKGGDDHFINLRPMNWRNNISKNDDYPEYIADVTSKENKNISKKTFCKVNVVLQEKLKKLYDYK